MLTHLKLSSLVVWTVACAVPATEAPFEPTDLGKADDPHVGDATGDVDPTRIDIDGTTIAGTVRPEDPAAFWVSTDGPTSIVLELEWTRSRWGSFLDGLAGETRYVTSISQFIEASDGEWMYVATTEPVLARMAVWEIGLPDAGRHLLRIDAPEASLDEASYAVRVRSIDTSYEDAGDVAMTVETESGASAHGLRVRVGGVEGIVAGNDLFLGDVPAGEHVVEVGHDLSGRPIGGDVVGDEPLRVAADYVLIVYVVVHDEHVP